MKTKTIRLSLLVALLLSMHTSQALATVDSYLPYTYIYKNHDAEQFCYGRSMMIAEIGIPIASLMEASFAPSYVLVQHISFPSEYRNINVLNTNPAIEWAYLNDSIDTNGISTFATEIDMGPYAETTGPTQQGRQATLDTAKLALLALAKNAQSISNNRFRLWVEFHNLPSQAGLTGTALVAKTKWPYNWQSKLLQAYEDELIGSFCR